MPESAYIFSVGGLFRIYLDLMIPALKLGVRFVRFVQFDKQGIIWYINHIDNETL